MEWMGAATVVFMVGLFQLSIEANLGSTGGMPFPDFPLAAVWRLHGALLSLDGAVHREMVIGRRSDQRDGLRHPPVLDP